MLLDFDLVDVFTDRPFAGNQLAVVHGAEGLSSDQCLALAREFNFSETTFPAAVTGSGEYSVRIFTPGQEIPFAGHPTLGTAAALRARDLLAGPEVVQVCGAGRIGVRFRDDLVELSASPRDLLGPLDDDLVAALLGDLGLTPADLAGPVWLAGCGLTFVHIPVADDAVARAVPSSRPLHEYADRLAAVGRAGDPVEGLNLFHLSGSGRHVSVHARVFVPGLSVPEDPATGSAAVGLGIALVASGHLPDGGAYTIEQGLEMGRPSVLHGRVETTVLGGHGWNPAGTDAAEGPVAAVCHVAGRVHHVGRGQIAVPPAQPPGQVS
ncbi:MAG TPA: PhzF family phenazine biosynthesis protein [Nocardioidaceae bacterium]|nr:PhzF family phenazine biosynthesis protein [Nocardioidaceae bacterium]